MRRHANELPEGRAAEKTLAEAELAELLHYVGTHTEAIARMSGQIVNDVLLTELVVFPASGFATREFGTSMGCVAVTNHSATAHVTVAAGGAVGDTSPVSGVGRARINAGTAMTTALTGPVVTLWGTPGEAATVQVFTRAWPPAFGAAGPALGSSAQTARTTGIVRYATGQSAHGTHPIPAGRRSYAVLVLTAGSATSPTLDGVPLPTGANLRYEAPLNDTLEAASLVTAAGDDVLYTEVV